jgi:hypothetical protein
MTRFISSIDRKRVLALSSFNSLILAASLAGRDRTLLMKFEQADRL